MQTLLKNEELGYNPKSYSFADYNLYLYYKETYDLYSKRSKDETTSFDNVQETSIRRMLVRYLDWFKALSEKDNSMNMDVISDYLNHTLRAKYIDIGKLGRELGGFVDTNENLEVKAFLADFAKVVVAVRWDALRDNPSQIAKYSPRQTYIDALVKAWETATRQDDSRRIQEIISDLNDTKDATKPKRALDHLKRCATQCLDIAADKVDGLVEMHVKNLKLVSSPDFEKRLIESFGLSKNPNPRTMIPSFLLRVYNDERFQHWLCQVLLATILLSAVLVMTALMVKVSLLPLAVATAVTGLSKFAANVLFGTALVTGVAATVAVAASLHARFFSKAPGGDGGAGGAENVEGQEMSALRT